jgi:hypothetical protein
MLPLAAEPTTAEALLRRCEEVDQLFSAQTARLCRNLAAIVEQRGAERSALAGGVRPGR